MSRKREPSRCSDDLSTDNASTRTAFHATDERTSATHHGKSLRPTITRQRRAQRRHRQPRRHGEPRARSGARSGLRRPVRRRLAIRRLSHRLSRAQFTARPARRRGAVIGVRHYLHADSATKRQRRSDSAVQPRRHTDRRVHHGGFYLRVDFYSRDCPTARAGILRCAWESRAHH